MHLAFFLVALAVAVLAVTAFADRVDFPAPLMLILGGVGASYVPGVPVVHLGPDVVLLGLLPPLLYATAISTSLVDFNANRRPILLLSIGLVVFTTCGVALVVKAIVPEVAWWEAFAIGGVVAPPDAVAATAIARKIGLPRRIVTILEGESLFNDATALVALRTAVAAAGTLVATGEPAGFHSWRIVVDFVLAAGGGVLVGLATFYVVAWLRRRITDPILDTAVSFVIPFAAYVAAERVEASGVIAVVVTGLLLGHKAPLLQTAQSRISERTTWRTIAFLLENTVFLLIGLQARWILQDVSHSTLGTGQIVAVCAATLVAVIVLRLVWVFPARYLIVRPPADDGGRVKAPWQFTVILGWAGMRGVVTLAAAFVIPEDAPYREVLLLVAFTVVAGTLFIQGLTLPMLARRLKVPSPDPMEDALSRASLLQQASNAGLAELERIEFDDDGGGLTDAIRERLDRRNFAAWERLGTVSDRESPSEAYARVRSEMIDAERRKVLEVRSSGSMPSQIVAEVLTMLDVEESMLDYAQQGTEELKTVNVSRLRRTGAVCDDLEALPPVETRPEPVCQACLDEGLRWVALRQCLVCDHVACCDSSPRRHATEHFHETTHPVMESAEPNEDWRWCYVHHLTA